MRAILQGLYALIFFTSGVGHFIRTEWYLRLMPPYLPWHKQLVWISGVCEIALAVFLLVPRFSAVAAWGLIALLIAVFPANIHMAVTSGTADPAVPGVSPFLAWARLPLQGVLIYWAYRYTGP